VKPLVEVAGRTILARQVDALATLGVRPSLVALDATPFAGTGLDVIADEMPAGALGALYTAVHRSATPHVLVLAGDMPFVTASFLQFLVSLPGDPDATVPRPAGRWQPLCAVYHRRVAAHLRRAIDADRWRVVDALEGLAVRDVNDAEIAPFDPDGRLLLNVNTPDDYRRADPLATL
jgi:molybdopterin-guanine dinucleotide biosynthesis protein A